jgi:hypothetical protein
MADEDVFRPDIPSTARMYDYYLGGKDNYPADREAAERAMALLPPGTAQAFSRENRKFLGRVVSFLVDEAKVGQFLDIGTGLPTMNQVHEVAQDSDPSCRIVYVDHDPIVLAHGRDMLDGVPHATIVKHDLRGPESILADPEVRELLDFSEPIALMLVAILHFIGDEDDPYRLVRALVDALPSGSFVALSHAVSDDEAMVKAATAGYSKATSTVNLRSRDQIAAFFDRLDLVEPGLVWLPQWHPDADTGLRDKPEDSHLLCGLARKP